MATWDCLVLAYTSTRGEGGSDSNIAGLASPYSPQPGQSKCTVVKIGIMIPTWPE